MTAPPEPGPSPAARLAALQEAGTTAAEALAFYDSLGPAGVDDLLGEWRGSGLRTGHPFDGLLERLGWYGKRFDGPEDAHPLLFDDGRGRVAAVDPAWFPVSLVARRPPLLRLAHHRAAVRLLRAGLPLLRTRRPRARLRMTEHRGVVTATLVYDALPVHDAFRSVDDRTVLGLMDMRGLDAPFLFVLRRVTRP